MRALFVSFLATLRRRPWHRIAAASVVLLAVQPLLAGSACAWWNSDWSYRMKLVADAGPKGANVTEPVGRTQILIRLHSGNFNFATASDDGTDLRVVAGDDRTPLHFHIERFDGLVDQVGLIWVDVPDLAPGTATPIFLYWGNKNATSASDSRASYDADRVLVYHFADENGLPKDATGYGNNALTPGKRDPGGMIGAGVRLDGSAPIRLPQSPSLAIAAGQAMTISLWVRPDRDVKSGVLYSNVDGPNGLTIGLDQGVAYARIDTPDGPKQTSAGTPLAGEGWHLISVEATADHLGVYVDGKPQGDVAAALPALNGPATLGGVLATAVPAPAAPAPAATPPAAVAPLLPPSPTAPATATPEAAPAVAPPAPAPNFVGLIDEFEISKVARPIGALQVAVASEGPDPKLLTFDVAEQSSFFGSGYIGIIMRSVTPDAWVIIGILGLMALVSWWVMLGKAVYLSRLSSANGQFRGAYRRTMSRAGADNSHAFGGLARQASPALQRSPLFRIYEVGAQQFIERLDAGFSEADGRLAPQSLAAIRAAVEAGLVQETQRLNRAMVLLTIAISGGPFIGLLGTVVGVMITFAAIAQAGDVNVNAIAPGIAAALLATVAGLFVAIPALFGYNYLIIRIRDLTSDMQTFVDELITRMGEGVRIRLPQAGE
jgi:biopolymer transport protein ExbB